MEEGFRFGVCLEAAVCAGQQLEFFSALPFGRDHGVNPQDLASRMPLNVLEFIFEGCIQRDHCLKKPKLIFGLARKFFGVV